MTVEAKNHQLQLPIVPIPEPTQKVETAARPLFGTPVDPSPPRPSLEHPLESGLKTKQVSSPTPVEQHETKANDKSSTNLSGSIDILEKKPIVKQKKSKVIPKQERKSESLAKPPHKMVKDNMFRRADFYVADIEPPKSERKRRLAWKRLLFWRKRVHPVLEQKHEAPEWTDTSQKKKKYVEDYGL